ncbi:Gfo/Idh/MocA family protein [Loigolactobacillus jiayinensis]|uniref:Gfo/Idh/MocA family protein n=1 Tax=Loigolactobacillus jiayinensis TaxID=2486016 RepID=A0ABW1RGW9_9LACO|nr:Gfo/Idh/MocA family oxidoreductase [Loigolactobacillus jiayinensis]
MLKIGVLGLGNIAQKAYLPVMARMQDQVEWVLCTRNVAKLQHLQQQYGFQHTAADLDALLAQKPTAIFIHTPTPTHAAYIEQCLRAGVHVYVDKPVSDNVADVKRLYQLAAQQGLLLTAGFNRRFAPFNAKLQQQPAQTVLVQKERVATLQPVPFVIFDLMPHVVDTALFLLGQTPTHYHYRVLAQHGALLQASVVMETPTATAYALLNMQAGANSETAEVQNPQGIAKVTDLATYALQANGMTTQEQFPDWTPNLQRRGFAPLIHDFVAAVQGKQANPVSPASSILTHQVCQNLLAYAQKNKLI